MMELNSSKSKVTITKKKCSRLFTLHSWLMSSVTLIYKINKINEKTFPKKSSSANFVKKGGQSVKQKLKSQSLMI